MPSPNQCAKLGYIDAVCKKNTMLCTTTNNNNRCCPDKKTGWNTDLQLTCTKLPHNVTYLPS